MLKPTISSVEEEIVDHLPHLVLIHNRAHMEDFSPSRFKIIQQVGTIKIHIISHCIKFLLNML